MKYYNIRVCSNCGKVLGKVPTEVKENHTKLTHGVCIECMRVLYVNDFTSEELEKIINAEVKRNGSTG